jgi:hypothetical protein
MVAPVCPADERIGSTRGWVRAGSSHTSSRHGGGSKRHAIAPPISACKAEPGRESRGAGGRHWANGAAALERMVAGPIHMTASPRRGDVRLDS